MSEDVKSEKAVAPEAPQVPKVGKADKPKDLTPKQVADKFLADLVSGTEGGLDKYLRKRLAEALKLTK